VVPNPIRANSWWPLHLITKELTARTQNPSHQSQNQTKSFYNSCLFVSIRGSNFLVSLSLRGEPLHPGNQARVIPHRCPHRLRNHFPDSNQESSTQTKNKTIYSSRLFSSTSSLMHLIPFVRLGLCGRPPFTLHNNPFTISHTYLASSPIKKPALIRPFETSLSRSKMEAHASVLEAKGPHRRSRRAVP